MQIGGSGLCFSSDSRLLVAADQNRVLRLVETQTGRTPARLESPDQSGADFATFGPDAARQVVTGNDPAAMRVWDLRAIRKRLVEMGLD
jgi:predicted DCC family thiol-disulfide oxidoreductase YuxK